MAAANWFVARRELNMDYLLLKLWPYLLLSLIWGGIIGYYVCPGRRSRDDA